MKFLNKKRERLFARQTLGNDCGEKNFYARHACAVKSAAAAAAACAAFFAPDAMAGTGGTEFDSVWQTLSDWTQGALGRIIAGSMVLVGIVSGVARQSLMAFAIGIGGGVGLYNAPNVIDSVLAATMQEGVIASVPEAVLNWAR